MVYDVTQTASFEHCLLWKRQIDDVVHLSNGDPIPIVLIANKVRTGKIVFMFTCIQYILTYRILLVSSHSYCSNQHTKFCILSFLEFSYSLVTI